jgi:hypothetical protein
LDDCGRFSTNPTPSLAGILSLQTENQIGLFGPTWREIAQNFHEILAY